ncbi:MAG: hypothetical protein C0404_13820 [Verrucomicrobia bacterium]|nr:hypothetical protein [Verrucomicrobiota bacterium]
MGIAGGLVAALVGAAVWAAVTIATKYQIGFMAVGVGFIVGYSVRFLGKGINNTFGIAGAILALGGCVLGNLATACGFVAAQESVPFTSIFFTTLVNPSIALGLLKAMFSPMDLLFYAIAGYEGYRFSFREITPEEVHAVTKKTV